MLNIAICEDNHIIAEKISKKIESFFSDKEIAVNIEIITDNKNLKALDINLYDLFCLDIEMGQTNGIDLGVKIRKNNPGASIIYISAYYTYAIAGYKARPIAFIMKDDKNFDLSLYEALQEFVSEKLNKKEYLLLKNQYEERNARIEDVIYLESFSRKLVYHFFDNRSMEVYGKMSDMENKLQDKGFIRVHKSYLVNMKYIRKISGYKVYLYNDTVLPSSQDRYTQITQTYALWKGWH